MTTQEKLVVAKKAISQLNDGKFKNLLEASRSTGRSQNWLANNCIRQPELRKLVKPQYLPAWIAEMKPSQTDLTWRIEQRQARYELKKAEKAKQQKAEKSKATKTVKVKAVKKAKTSKRAVVKAKTA